MSRRRFLKSAAATSAATLLGGIAKPYLSRAADRPLITHGVQSGDVSIDSGMVWARADRPARMLVEAATTESFHDIIDEAFLDVLPESDFTGKLLLDNLPAGQDIFYRVRLQDLSEPAIAGEPMVGRFRTAPADRRNVSFVWSGDTCGQGWGIDEARGGLRTYATMLDNRPDFFIHSGDSIYADCAIPTELKLPDGGIWKNLVTEDKSATAETLHSSVAITNTICSTPICARSMRRSRPLRNGTITKSPMTGGRARRCARDGYQASNASLLAARGARAFREFMPMRETPAEPGRVYRKIAYGPLLDVFMLDMRSYRGPNGEKQASNTGRTRISSGRGRSPG